MTQEILWGGRRAGKATRARMFEQRMQESRWSGRLLRVTPAAITVEIWRDGEIVSSEPAPRINNRVQISVHGIQPTQVITDDQPD